MRHDLVKPGVICMEFVNGPFVSHPQVYQQDTGQCHRKPGDIKKGKLPVPQHVPANIPQIVSDHIVVMSTSALFFHKMEEEKGKIVA